MADREGGGVTYAPNLVPQSQLEDEAIPRVIDLERFLEEELSRIATAMVASVVQAAYGALEVRPGPAADQPLTDVPAVIVGWNNSSPLVPNRITTDITIGQSLVPEEGGIYQASLVLVATVDSGAFYSMSMAVNGQSTGIFTSIDASQQTTVVTFVFHAVLALNPGDICVIVGVTQAQGSPHTFIIESGIFSLIRVSERNDEPGQF